MILLAGTPANERGEDGCYSEAILWSAACSLASPPRDIFLTHGHDNEASVLANRIQSDFGWKATVGEYDKTYCPE